MNPKLFFPLIGLIGIFFSTQAQEDKSHEELPPGWIALPKTPVGLKIGGYVKFDLIHDFNPINSPDFFDVSKIPTDDSEGASTHMHAKETRLIMDVRSRSKVGELRGFVEGDFYGSGGSFRLRHGYVEIAGKWLAGQTWTNFMDETMIPPTLDFEKPAAYAFARHGLFRFKQSLSKDAYVALAVEEPSASAQSPTNPGKLESPLPDFTARYRVTKHWGHFQLSSFFGQLRFQPTVGAADNVFLYGVNLSGLFVVFKKDKLAYQVLYGPGVARYRGGISAGIDENDKLEAIVGVGYTVTYLHQWSHAFSSLFVFNYGEEDNTRGQPANDVNSINYMAINLLWHFAENAFAGVEYLRGTRTDIDDSDGTANRLQFSVRYSFNMN